MLCWEGTGREEAVGLSNLGLGFTAPMGTRNKALGFTKPGVVNETYLQTRLFRIIFLVKRWARISLGEGEISQVLFSESIYLSAFEQVSY